MARTSYRNSGPSLISELEALKAPASSRTLDDLLTNAAAPARDSGSKVEDNLRRLFEAVKSPALPPALPRVTGTGAGAITGLHADVPLKTMQEVKQHALSQAPRVLLKVPGYPWGECAVGQPGRPVSGATINLNLTFGRTRERAETRRSEGRGDDFLLKSEGQSFQLIALENGKTFANVEVFAARKQRL